jgi:hypothetical protein
MSSINIAHIKYDLMKIIEPHDGVITARQKAVIFRLFNSYFRDLRFSGAIRGYNIDSEMHSETTITYDVSIKFASERSPKHVKIHVNTFSYPWTAGRSVNKHSKPKTPRARAAQ